MSSWLPVQPDTIPSLLRDQPWVLWRAEPQPNAKPRKVPYRVADPGVAASSTDRTSWATFDDAVDAYRALAAAPADPRRGPVVGIGVVLTSAARITCFDLDRVIDAAKRLDVRATTIVERCDSWTEESPSGTGLHIFVRGTVPHAVKGDQIEIYADARYIAVTGHQWPGTPADLRPQQAYLDHLVALARAGGRPRRPWTGPSTPPPDDLVGALLAKLQTWGIPATRLKRWSDGYLVDLAACPWADEHTTGPGGAAVMIHASGAFDFACQHAHCAGRDWRDFRTAMEHPA